MGTCLQSQKQTEFQPLLSDPDESKQTSTDPELIRILIFGYIRAILSKINEFNIIPIEILSICCDYYGQQWTISIHQISIDRYGFPLQPAPKYNIDNEERHRSKVRFEKELLDKYMQLLYGTNIATSNKNITHDFIMNNNKLISLIRNHGIPHQLRGIIWPKLLNIDNKKQSFDIHINGKSLYQDLIDINKKHQYPAITLKSVSRIYRKHTRFGMTGMEKELNYDPLCLHKIRIQNTTKQDPLYLNNYDKDRNPDDLVKEQIDYFFMHCTSTQKEIWNITKAFHGYKPELGVICCGGLFQITPFLLLFMTEEDVFWSLICLLENSDKYLWIPETTPWSLYFYCVERMTHKYLRKISNHFVRNGISSPSMYQANSWFATIFTYGVFRDNFDVLTRIWDLYLLDGGIVIYKAGLAILKYYEHDILNAATFEDILQLISKWGDINDFDMERYFKIVKGWKFTNNELDKLVVEFKQNNSNNS